MDTDPMNTDAALNAALNAGNDNELEPSFREVVLEFMSILAPKREGRRMLLQQVVAYNFRHLRDAPESKKIVFAAFARGDEEPIVDMIAKALDCDVATLVHDSIACDITHVLAVMLHGMLDDLYRACEVWEYRHGKKLARPRYFDLPYHFTIGCFSFFDSARHVHRKRCRAEGRDPTPPPLRPGARQDMRERLRAIFSEDLFRFG